MYTPRIGDAFHALWRANLQDALTGSYVEGGLDASPGSSGTSIQVDVDPGDVRINDSPLSIAGDTLTFDAVSTDGEYRADVIYATVSGGLAVEKGNSAQPKPTIDDDDPYPAGDPQPARRLFAPSPPDSSGISGLPIHVVMVADTASDSTDLALEDLVDYRIAAPQPGEHAHPGFALNRRTVRIDEGTAQFVKLAQVSRGVSGTVTLRTVVTAANTRGNGTVRRLDHELAVAGSTVDTTAYAHGERAGATDLIVTREAASTAGTTEDRFHLYAYVPVNADPYIAQIHTDGTSGTQFGEYDLETGLSENDLVGSVEHDTGGQTGGPGGELAVPYHADRAVAVEAETDVADLSGAAGNPGNVPVRGSGGGVDWKNRVPTSGEWVPLWSGRFGKETYSTSETSYTAVLGPLTTLPIPTGQIEDDRYADLGVTLTAHLTTGASDDTVRARLARAADTGIVSGTEIEATGDTVTTLSSGTPGALTEFRRPQRMNLQMEVNRSNAVGEIYSPSVSVFGRMP